MKDYKIFSPDPNPGEQWWYEARWKTLEPGAWRNNPLSTIKDKKGFSYTIPDFPADGEYHTIVIKYDNGKVTKYVDGKEVKQ